MPLQCLAIAPMSLARFLQYSGMPLLIQAEPEHAVATT